jgi:hypothetical protein
MPDSLIPKCSKHEDIVVHVELLQAEVNVMQSRIEAVEAKVYSPAVIVAFFTLLGTCITAAGSVLGVLMIAFAKAHGWM